MRSDSPIATSSAHEPPAGRSAEGGRRLGPGVRLAVAALLLAAAAPAAAAVPPWSVEEMPIELRLEGTGRLEAARSLRLRVVPRAYRGPLVVAEVLRSGGVVRAGEVLLRLESAELERELERSRLELEEARIRLDLLVAEQRMQAESASRRVERAERGFRRSEQALAYHRSTGDERQFRGAELRLRGGEDGLLNQRQELEQLEAMYAGTSLASETKDIVLERARRAVARAEESLALSRIDHALYLETQRAERLEDLEEAAAGGAIELAHARVSRELEEIRRRLALAESQRRVADLQRKVEELQADLQAMEVRAPAEGLLGAISLRSGDAISPRQALTDLIDPTELAFPIRLGPQEIAWAEDGMEVEVSVPDAPGLRVRGRLLDLLPIGVPEGRSVRFPARVALPAATPRLRIGMEARAEAIGRTEGVLAVPLDAIREQDGRTIVMVLVDGSESPRPVVIGRRGIAFAEVIEGLSPGDRVVREAPPAGDGDPVPAREDS